MITIANTFIYTVLTYLTLYRYVVQQNESFQEVFQIHFQWQTVYLSSMLVVLYTTHSVASEVYIYMEYFCLFKMFTLQLQIVVFNH